MTTPARNEPSDRIPGAPHSVRSADGPRIAFDRVGDGPPVIMVEAAAHYRAFSSFSGLVPLLSREFTVYTYDRRGRGESTDVTPYAPDREVEDLEALIAQAGGSAHLYGYSSGALLALRAAARGLPVRRLAVLEPPLADDDASRRESELTVELDVLRAVAAGNSNKIVADRLDISEETVKSHMRTILSKLSANDRTHAVTIALKRGIIDLP